MNGPIGIKQHLNGFAQVPPPPPIRSEWPRYDEDEIAAVSAVLRSGCVNSLLHGDNTRRFEEAFTDYIGVPHAIATANGTLALELALRALGIGPGDEVVVTPRSYFASVSCVVAVGATPVFADIDPISQNIDPDSIEAVITPRTRAVICVHLAGWPCDMARLSAVCRTHGLKLIEDCAQALGARYHGQRIGSFGDAAAFSFCTDKIISTGGEGGMLLIRDEQVWDRAWSYKDHGKSLAKHLDKSTSNGCFRWLHDEFGSNYRLTEMQSAIGLLQFRKLPDWLAARRANAAALDEELGRIPALRVVRPPEHVEHAYYKYYVFLRDVPAGDDGAARDALVLRLQKLGVPCGPGSCPEIYRETAFAETAWRPLDRLPVARSVGAASMMLPIDPTLGIDDMRQIGERMAQCLQEQIA